MFLKIARQYKTQLFISIILSIVLIALKVTTQHVQIGLIVLGTLLGTFILDLDYFIHAYFLEPTSDFSKTLTGFMKHGDLGNALSYVYYHRDEIKDKTLNSVLFQVVLGGLIVFVASSDAPYFIKALVFSTFVNSIYRMYESHLLKKTDEWFWALKSKPKNNGVGIFAFVLLGILVYCLSIF